MYGRTFQNKIFDFISKIIQKAERGKGKKRGGKWRGEKRGKEKEKEEWEKKRGRGI
jgi:hypothetical protein